MKMIGPCWMCSACSTWYNENIVCECWEAEE